MAGINGSKQSGPFYFVDATSRGRWCVGGFGAGDQPSLRDFLGQRSPFLPMNWRLLGSPRDRLLSLPPATRRRDGGATFCYSSLLVNPRT